MEQTKPSAAPEQKAAQGKLLIDCKGIKRSFYIGTSEELEILHGIDLQIFEGQFVAIVGASGSGKSTLMNIIGALDQPTAGTCLLDGMDISKEKDDRLSEVRNKEIGFVFQSYNLISRTTACENVQLPMLYAKVPPKKRKERALQMLDIVGMSDRAYHLPNEMSGGQRQRVSIARAMANDPKIILADEPTGALDSKTGHLVMDIFHDLHLKHGKTILLVTHSPELAQECERVVTIKDGSIISDEKGAGKPNER
ncbi:MAG: ABC transporter ATP-binding protein [Ruthenibacterium sp.]